MFHLPNFVIELTVILLLAGAASLACRFFKQPTLLGYVLAGLVVSPNLDLVPKFTEQQTLQTWADIGALFLLFGLGLEFSFRKLLKIGGRVLITASVEIPLVIGIGFLLGRLLDWSYIQSVFLGCILAIASSTVVNKVFDDFKLKSKSFAQLVLGVCIFEDIVAVVLLIFLSSGISAQSFSGPIFFTTVFKLIFFLTIWYILGILIIPSTLRFLEKYMNQELRLIFSLGLCFLMVYITTGTGFSPALGAFMMGSLLAESEVVEEIQKAFHAVRDLFGAIFFVSVGMLMDPKVMLSHGGSILLITTCFILVKWAAVSGGALLAGYSLRNSVRAGVSMTQIGEFSFILAALGLSTGAIDQLVYPMAVAIFFITSITTPFFVKRCDGIATWIEKKMPATLHEQLTRYQGIIQRNSSQSDWRLFLRQQALNVFLLVVGTTAITLGISWLARRYVFAVEELTLTHKISLFLVTVTLSSPLLWGLVWGSQKNPMTQDLWQRKVYRGPIFVIISLRAFLAVFLLLVSFAQYFEIKMGIAVGSTVLISILWFFSHYFERYYQRISSQFLSKITDHLQNRKEDELPLLTPWDVQLVPIPLSAHSSLAGQTLQRTSIREKYGVTVAMVERQGHRFTAPDPGFVIFPGDILHCLGQEEEMDRLRAEAETSKPQLSSDSSDISLTSMRIRANSPLAGKSIKGSGLREDLSALVVGIERKERRIVNPDADFIFEEGDLVWLVADKSRFRSFVTQ